MALGPGPAVGLWPGGMTRALLLLLAALPALASCGSREPLRPKAGQALPPKAAMAAKAPTTEQLLTPPPTARPERQDEGLRRSEEREDDPFDLPPTR